MADLSKQWDTEDEDMEETETPAVTAPEPTPETGAPEEPAAPAPVVAPEEQQETAMETEQVKYILRIFLDVYGLLSNLIIVKIRQEVVNTVFPHILSSLE